MKKQKSNKNFLQRHKIKLTALLILFLIWWFCLPSTLFDNPGSTVVESRQGVLLGARIADDGQWRFPEADSIPYRFKESILYFEDEHFYRHPGINPVSTFKALWANLTTDKRRGGSTITQQVMRLAHKNPKRTYLGKFIETFQATRLEVHYSKENILKLYVSHAPFGGNVVGLPAASWRYFGIAPEDLSWAQAAALAVLPNAPALIYPGKNEEILLEKRNALLHKLWRNSIIDQTTYELALTEPLPGKPLPLPDIAPHFTEKIRKEKSDKIFHSTLDLHLQQKVNEVVQSHYSVLKLNEIHNMAVLVLDVETREVLAYVGNTPTTQANGKYVDIISKPRSTGSILKPFLYAAMLDDGELLPDMLVADIPTNIDGYIPKNFDKTHQGIAPASLVLTQSLNVPSVRMLKDYGLDKFKNKLMALNQKHIIHPSDYYGLTLILGGAESSLWDVTNAYAGMASLLQHYQNTSDEYFSEEFNSPIYNTEQSFDLGKKLLHPPVYGAGAVYKTLKTLEQVNRPEGEGNWKYFESAQPIAWKTGTSYGFKDAWAVGTTTSYTIGVWVGNADGEGRPGLVGIEAAAPVLFDILSSLPAGEDFAVPFDDLTTVEICTKSGHLAGLYCEETKEERIPVKGIKTRSCPYHKQYFLDKTLNYRVNSSCYPLEEMTAKNLFSLPPVEEYYYKAAHPNYSGLPPFKFDCIREGELLMDFIYPKSGQAIILPKDFDEEINEVIFRLAHRGKTTSVYWYLDDEFLGETFEFHEMAVIPKPGTYMLLVIDQEGNELRERILIKEN